LLRIKRHKNSTEQVAETNRPDWTNCPQFGLPREELNLIILTEPDTKRSNGQSREMLEALST
jgi:hypothetical protein